LPNNKFIGSLGMDFFLRFGVVTFDFKNKYIALKKREEVKEEPL